MVHDVFSLPVSQKKKKKKQETDRDLFDVVHFRVVRLSFASSLSCTERAESERYALKSGDPRRARVQEDMMCMMISRSDLGQHRVNNQSSEAKNRLVIHSS